MLSDSWVSLDPCVSIKTTTTVIIVTRLDLRLVKDSCSVSRITVEVWILNNQMSKALGILNAFSRPRLCSIRRDANTTYTLPGYKMLIMIASKTPPRAVLRSCNVAGTIIRLRALPWRRHQMETFSALLGLCAGNSPVTGEFPSQNQWRWALMFSLICAWINGWINNPDAGDLRRHRAHYDVTGMSLWSSRK